jgi:UDPglucose 6-dehydrogenase
LQRLKSALKRPILIDLRNIYQADEMMRHGFQYQGVGRKFPSPQEPAAALVRASR